VISVGAFLVDIFVDYVLFIGDVVQAGACEFEMIEIMAVLTRFDLEFIRDVFAFVAEEAEEFVVHVALAEDLDEGLVTQRVED
jgi:hypothetical protein